MKSNNLIFFSGLYGATAAFLKLAGFVIFLWLARTLSVEDYAQFGLFYALQTGMAIFATAGIYEVVVGLLKHNQEEESRERLFGLANSAFMIMAVVSIVVVAFAYQFFAKDAIATFVYVLVVGVFMAFSMLQSQIARINERHLQALLFNFLVPLSGLVGASIAFYLDRTLESFFLGTAIGVSSTLMVLLCLKLGFYKKAKRASDARVIFRVISPFFLIAFFGWLSGYGNNYFVEFLLEFDDVAQFTFLLSLSTAIQLVASALNQVWSPRFYRISQEYSFNEVESQNRIVFRWLGIALGVTGSGLIVFYPIVLDALGGNLVTYQSMEFELLLMVLAYIFVIPWWHCHNYYLIHGKGDELMKITLITSAAGIAAWVLLMWQLGSLGVYIGFFTQMLLRALGIVVAAKKHWSVRVAWDGVALGALVVIVVFIILKL